MSEINIGKKRKKGVLNIVILRGGVLQFAQKAKSHAKNVLRKHALWKMDAIINENNLIKFFKQRHIQRGVFAHSVEKILSHIKRDMGKNLSTANHAKRRRQNRTKSEKIEIETIRGKILIMLQGTTENM